VKYRKPFRDHRVPDDERMNCAGEYNKARTGGGDPSITLDEYVLMIRGMAPFAVTLDRTPVVEEDDHYTLREFDFDDALDRIIVR
jgi:hypothetical protein